jgi:predicted dehydrogenase
MSEPLGWGLIGTGGIADTFAADLTFTDSGRVTAVGSRRMDSADRFADRIDIPNRYASYEALVADPDVDVVYVATPHPMHHAGALLALGAGKPVLVEKPFTMNAAEAQELVTTARAEGLFLMEAMWTRFLPHIGQIRRLVSEGALGDIVTVTADHGQWFPKDRDFRLFAPELGGGALLDLGVYPVSFASMVLGTGHLDLHALSQEPDPRGDRRYRRPHRDRRRLLRADVVHPHLTRGRANQLRRAA